MGCTESCGDCDLNRSFTYDAFGAGRLRRLCFMQHQSGYGTFLEFCGYFPAPDPGACLQRTELGAHVYISNGDANVKQHTKGNKKRSQAGTMQRSA